ncbi:MAG: tetratricopeptide repeat protein [Bacteroidota bacterium]
MKLRVFPWVLIALVFTNFYTILGQSTTEERSDFERAYQIAYSTMSEDDAKYAVEVADNHKENGKAYHLLGYILEIKSDIIGASKALIKAENSYAKADLLKLQAGVCERLGVIFYQTFNYNHSLTFYNKTLHLRKSLNDPQQSDTKFNIGLAHQKLGNYDSAAHYFFMSLNDYEQNDQLQDKSEVLHQIAFLQMDIQDYEKADIYYLKALDIASEVGDSLNMAKIYNDMGMNYLYQEDLLAAESYLKKSLQVKTGLDRPGALLIAYSNLGELAMAKGRLDEAENYYSQAASYWEPGNTSKHAIEAFTWLVENSLDHTPKTISLPLAQIAKTVSKQQKELSQLKQFFEGQLATRAMEMEREQEALLKERIYWGGTIGLLLIGGLFTGLYYWKRYREADNKINKVVSIVER